MKRTIAVIFFTTLVSCLFAQEQRQGNVYGKIFSNFHHTLEGETNRAFEIKRAYLGYDHIMDNNFSGHLKLDIGSPDDQSPYALLKRYAYFKNAYLKYQKNNLTLNFGLVDNFQYKMQEKFWAHRYIYKSFMDEHDFGTSADIGLTAAYKISEKVTADFGILNGEGYKSLQSDNSFLTEGALTVRPLEQIILRGFYSISRKDVSEHTYALFAGYTPTESVKIGGEFNVKQNMNNTKGQDALGFSLYTMYDFNDQWQVFGRYDKLSSEVQTGEDTPWNILNDGSAMIGGIQFRPIPDISLSINYQDWVPWAANLETESYVYFNMLYKL